MIYSKIKFHLSEEHRHQLDLLVKQFSNDHSDNIEQILNLEYLEEQTEVGAFLSFYSFSDQPSIDDVIMGQLSAKQQFIDQLIKSINTEIISIAEDIFSGDAQTRRNSRAE